FGGDRLGPLPPGWAWQAQDLSADGKLLAVVGNVSTGVRQVKLDPAIRLLDTATGKELCALKYKGWVRSLRLSPDGKLLASDGADGIQVWDAVTGKERFHVPGQRPHGGTLVFSPDTKWLAWAGDQDRSVHLWDVAAGKEVRRWPTQHDKIRVLVFSA